MSEFEFDRAIAHTALGDGAYTIELDPGWVVGGGLNGGYLLATIGNAVRAELDHPDPYTISAYYLSPSQPGPATVTVRRVRTGRRTATVAATLSQDHEGQSVERITALATFGHLDRDDSERTTIATPPELPPLDECVLTSEAPEEVKSFVPMLDRVAMRMDQESVGAFLGTPSGKNHMQSWFEFPDDRPIDSIALLCVVDTLPPTTFALGMPGWAPTLELTAHVRCHPAPGPVRVRHETRNFAGGFFEEDCEVWDEDDRLVAQSRQLALMPRPA